MRVATPRLCIGAEVAIERDRARGPREGCAKQRREGRECVSVSSDRAGCGAKLAGTLLRNGIAISVVDLDAAKVAEFTAKGAGTAETPQR